jgi:hypothetical protein
MTVFLLYAQANIPDAPLLHRWWGAAGSLVTEKSEFVLQWGNAGLSAREHHAVVLNGREAIENAADSTVTEKMLAAVCVPYAGKEKSVIATVRRYIAIVFQQDIVSLYHSSERRLWLHHGVREGEEEYEEIEVMQNMREIRRIRQYAVRAVYALGLDFAAVYFGVDLYGTVRVLKVTPTFQVTQTLAEKFTARVKRFCREYAEQTEPIRLGADVEFVLRSSSGKLVLASSCLPKEGIVGCDRITLRSDDTKTSMPLAELRPVPGNDAKELFRNLYRAMMIGIQKIESMQIEWIAGGMPLEGYPIGGHIHFSGLAPNSQLLRALDTYLTLSVFMIESTRSLTRRPRYGQLGDMRYQFHGGFEYRTLPSWIVSPKIARGVLALSHLIVHSYRELRVLPLLTPEMHHAFYKGDRDAIAPLIPSLWEELRKLDGYTHYASYLEPFAQQVLARTEWEEYADIRLAWKLPPFQPQTSSEHRAYEHSMI